MDRPKFVPIGYCKGWSKEKNEWIYGWHWYHLTQAGKNSHITHYIRVQKDYDFGLSYHKDYEVTNCGFYINFMDKNGIPLFIGDKVFCKTYEGKKIIGKIRMVMSSSYNSVVVESGEGRIFDKSNFVDFEYREELQNE